MRAELRAAEARHVIEVNVREGDAVTMTLSEDCEYYSNETRTYVMDGASG